METAHAISRVVPGSLAHKSGIRPGDRLISVNGNIPVDFLDYRYLITDERLKLKFQKNNGRIIEFVVEKEYDDDLGIEFKNPYMDKLRTCKNKCVFCFIDQMPPGMRKTLYVKDDDYRMSLVRGNFISLTNLEQDDIERIIYQKLSPLYVSIHTTNMALRQKMMGNPAAGKLNSLLEKLTSAGIRIHGQVVLCPGLNDGLELERTISDLANLWPGIASVAVVPVGLTDFRYKLYPLECFNMHNATGLIEQVEPWQQDLREKLGYTFVFLADEFYLLAGKELPPYEDYEDFPQLENGVGLVAVLEKGFEALPPLPLKLPEQRTVTIVTGVLAAPVLNRVLKPFAHVKNLDITIHPVYNNFFGRRITVAGLVVGKDIAEQLKSVHMGDEVLLPEVMFKDDEDIFLDGVTLSDLESELGVRIRKVKMNSRDLAGAVLGS